MVQTPQLHVFAAWVAAFAAFDAAHGWASTLALTGGEFPNCEGDALRLALVTRTVLGRGGLGFGRGSRGFWAASALTPTAWSP